MLFNYFDNPLMAGEPHLHLLEGAVDAQPESHVLDVQLYPEPCCLAQIGR